MGQNVPKWRGWDGGAAWGYAAAGVELELELEGVELAEVVDGAEGWLGAGVDDDAALRESVR
jgi:hypothetical protein